MRRFWEGCFSWYNLHSFKVAGPSIWNFPLPSCVFMWCSVSPDFSPRCWTLYSGVKCPCVVLYSLANVQVRSCSGWYCGDVVTWNIYDYIPFMWFLWAIFISVDCLIMTSTVVTLQFYIWIFVEGATVVALQNYWLTDCLIISSVMLLLWNLDGFVTVEIGNLI